METRESSTHGFGEFWVCVDCVAFAANGPDESMSAERVQQLSEAHDGLVLVCVDDSEPSFSWSSCAVCKDSLGGDRYLCHLDFVSTVFECSETLEAEPFPYEGVTFERIAHSGAVVVSAVLNDGGGRWLESRTHYGFTPAEAVEDFMNYCTTVGYEIVTD